MLPGAAGPKGWARTQHADGALIETKSSSRNLRFLTTNESGVVAVALNPATANRASS